MTTLLNFTQLNSHQIDQYREAVTKAFPPVLAESDVIRSNWADLETYYPDYQLYITTDDGDVIGFMNTVPFYFDRPLADLPQEGWDWMLKNGIDGYGSDQPPNYLGGLQVIVRAKYQNQAYSQVLLKAVKERVKQSQLQTIVIPIRPTGKHEYPWMPMETYMELRSGERLHDPWIRTHLRSGAQVIKVCQRSMTITGDIQMWERLLGTKCNQSGSYVLKGALTPVSIDLENKSGEYIEPNIWIRY